LIVPGEMRQLGAELMKMRLLPFAVLALSCAVSPAAVTLITPTSASAALSFTPPTPGINFFPVGNIVNDSGLSGAATIANYTTITHGGASASTAWTTDDPAPLGGDWFAEGNAPVAITMPLGGNYFLTDLVFWGYHFTTPNGNEARAFTVEFSTNGGASYGASANVAQALGAHTIQNAATLSLGGTFEADTVRLTITDNQAGGGAAGGDRLGLGEVKLIGDTVPEPSAAMLGGLALLGLLRRRR
jgi:hypothetical protein